MKRFLCMFVLLALPLSASAATSHLVTARLAYQQGLFLQRTTGDLNKALSAYDRALEAATDAEDGELVEDVLLRRSEIFKLLGRPEELQTTIAALRKKSAVDDAKLGPATIFPPECEFVLHIDLQKLLSSPLLSKIANDTTFNIDDQNLDQIKSLLGFDPLHDLSTLTVGFSLSDNEEMPVEHWIVRIAGKFGKFNLPSLIEAKKKELKSFLLKTRTIQGVEVTLFRIPLDQDPKHMQTIGIARPADDTVLAGDLRSIERTLAAWAGKAPGLRANTKLMRMLSRLPTGTSFWLAGNVERVLKKVKGKLGKLPMMPDKLPEIEGLLLTASLANDLTISASAWAADAQSAGLLGDLLRGIAALAQLAPIEEPLVKKAVRSITVDSKDLQVSVSATLPAELLDQAIEEHQGKAKIKKVHLVMKLGEKRTLSFAGITHIKVVDSSVADVQSTGSDKFNVKAIGKGKTTIKVSRQGKPGLVVKLKVN
jgi:hypothetical protein